MASIVKNLRLATRPKDSTVSTKQFQFDDFVFHERIGQGGCGTVTRVSFKKPYIGHKEAAVKNVLELKKNEIDILARIYHTNIVVLYGFIQKGPMNMIVLEYAPLGSVRDYIKNNGYKPVCQGLFFKWLRESALALQHLHSNHVIHRDIKAANCILFDGYLLKLADFGIARYIGESMTTSSAKGTWRYMAPEINSENHFSFASDLYAYGMLAEEMVSGKEPFEGLEWQNVVYKVVESSLTPDIPDDCPKLVALLMRYCWSKDPRNRPTADDAVDILHSDHTARFSDLRLVVMGSKGAGKTATTRHVLLQRNATATTAEDAVPKRTSRVCKRMLGEACGTKMSIVDTPVSFGRDTDSDLAMKNIIAQIKFLSTPGPHAFLMVIRVHSAVKQVQDMVVQFRRCFGGNFLRHTIIIFTDDCFPSRKHLQSSHEYIHSNREIQQMLEDCGNRYMFFDNACARDSMRNQEQVCHLLVLINKMIKANGGKCIKGAQ